MGTAAQSFVTSKAVEPGIRGGLLLLVLWLGVVDPLYSAGLNMYVAAQSHPANLDWTYILVRAAMRISAALALLFVRRAVAVWFALAVLWLSGPFYVLVNWALFDNQVMPFALIRSTGVAAACTWYLLRSERVKATYGFELRPVRTTPETCESENDPL
jgi:uncharacterized membrane protein YciS (DUF1049 family)